MDSATQLALMSKAKKVFGSDGTFLSFPVSPLPYSKRLLDFYSQQNADDLRQSLQNLQAFSMLVNLIPSDEAWLPEETRFLWEAYEQVLKQANFASVTRTPEEEATYQAAFAYLRIALADGSGQDSPATISYRQHKDAYLLAQQKYLAAKSTAECAIDPLEKQRWLEVDEPAQRAQLDALQAEWIMVGHKAEVEAAQSTVISLGARSPLQTWAEWNSRFNRDLDAMSGAADTSTVFPSFFAPANALDEGAWKPFKLSEEEVKVLLSAAPAELRARFSAEGTDSSVKSLAFEFSSAAIVRPWFVADAFRARFWRFADAADVISDGATPPAGLCPAYVTAIVFARRVAIELKPEAQAGSSVKPFDGFRFNVAVQDSVLRTRIEREALVAVAAPEAPEVESNIQRVKLTTNRHTLGMESMASTALSLHSASRGAAFTRKGQTAISATRPFLATLAAETVAVAAASAALPPPAPPPVQDDTIYILAFICKPVPKCPNPDPALHW